MKQYSCEQPKKIGKKKQYSNKYHELILKNMRPFIVIFKHEIFCLFISSSTYIASFYFLTLLGVGFHFFLQSFAYTDWILPPLSSLAIGLFFGAPALVPFLTMRSFAEERKNGTLETLLTTPIAPEILVLGKWSACFFFFTKICVLAFIYPIILLFLYPEQGFNLGFTSIHYWVGCGLYLLIYGASFTAIGVFASIMTKNQMVAGMLSFTLITLYISLMALSTSAKKANDENPKAGYDFFEQSLAPFTNGFDKLEQFSVGFINLSTIFHQVIFTIFILILSSVQLNRLNK